MPTLSQITHSNSNTRKKVNYFSDYFKHYTHLIGKNVDFPFENLLSVIHRLEYQIKFNNPNRVKYIPHLTLKFQSYDNDISNSFSKYQIVYAELESFKTVTSRKNNWISNSLILNNDLIELKNELENELFNKSLQELIIALRCKHKLITHKRLIKQITKTIVTELIFSNRSQKEVEKVISKIMSKKENVFPLSAELLCKKDDENYKALVDDFFRHRTFKEQFEGILNYHRRPKTKVYFLFRLMNFRLPQKEIFEYDNVTIVSKNSKELTNIKRLCKDRFFLKDFFNSPNFVIAYTEVEYHEFNIGKEMAIQRIQKTLNFMNNLLLQSGNLDSSSCLTTANFKDIGGMKEANSDYIKIDVKKLNNSNPYNSLNSSQAICKYQFLEFESIYNSALIENKIPNYWHYLECIFLFGINQVAGHKLVIEKVSKILAQHFHKDYFLTYKMVIFNCLNGYMPNDSEISFSYKEANEIWEDFESIDIKEKTKRFENPFIADLNKALANSKKRKFKFDSFQYFKSLFLELFEARNTYMHKGYLAPRTDIKMQTIIPPLIKILRRKIIKKIKVSKRRDLKSVITSLVNQY